MKRTILTVTAILLITLATAQDRKKKNTRYNQQNKKENTFLHKQWWIGLKGGANVSQMHVDRTFSVIAPGNYDPSVSRKKYDDWTPAGTQAGIDITFFFKGFSASVQPAYQSIRWQYSTFYEWTQPEDQTQRLTLDYTHGQRSDYIFVPLLLRYEKTFGKFSPYIQAGGYGGFLIDGSKELSVTGTDYASGGVNEFTAEPIEVGARDLFAQAHYGLAGGLGVFYKLGNVRLNLDLQYRHGLTLFNDPDNRYRNDRLSGTGDAMDNVFLRNVAVSVGTLFPLRFLGRGFKSSIEK